MLFAIKMKNQKIIFELGQPHAGWVPVKLHHLKHNFQFEGSVVPNNPIEELMSAIILICDGVTKTSQITWNLEPYCYYFQFEKDDDNYMLSVSESDDFQGPQKLTHKIKGTFDQIILPIYRALRNFETYEFSDRAWPEIKKERSMKMKLLVKDKQKVPNKN